MPTITTSLYNAKTRPFVAMRSAMSLASLPLGEWALVQNWRWDKKNVRVRDGIQAMTGSALIASAEYRGHWEGTMNGNSYIVIALKDGSAVKLVKVADLTAAVGSWSATEVTAASGPHGSTRFTNTTNFVSFAPARDTLRSRDYLICNNGSDDPRIFDPQGDMVDGTVSVVTHSEITPPTDGRDIVATASFPAFVGIGGATPTFTTSDGDIVVTNSSAGTAENNLLVTFASSTDQSDSAEVTWASTITMVNSSTVWFLVESATLTTLLERIKIEFRLTSTSYVIQYDASSATNNFREEVPDGSKVWVGIPITNMVSGSVIDRMRITYVHSVSTTAAMTLKIYGIFFSGGIRGGTEFGVTFCSFDAKAQSVGQVVGNVQGERLSRVGATSLDGSRIPIFEQISYQYSVRHKTYATADQKDVIFLYIKRPGDYDFLYHDRDSMTEWDGASWARSSGATGGHNTITVGETGDPPSVVVTLVMPDGDHKPIPSGKYMLAANDRLFVGNINGARSEVWFSEDRDYTKFRKSLRTDELGNFDPRSPGLFRIGTEVVQGFAAVPGDTPGINSVYIFGDASLSVVDGLDAFGLSRRRIKSLTGTLSPRSIHTYRSDVFWIDSDMQVRMLSQGRIYELSRYDVDDKLQAIPASRRDDIVLTFWKDRLRIAYTTAAGSANTRCLLYNAIEQVWEADDLFPGACTGEGFFVWIDRTNNRPRLLSIGSDAKVYEIEASGLTTDLGSNIATKLTTGDVTKDVWQTLYIQRLGFVVDDAASGTVAVVVTYKPTGLTQTFPTTSLDVGTTQSYLWLTQDGGSMTFSSATAEHFGIAAQIAITTTLPGGTVLHSIQLEHDEYGDKATAGTTI